MMSNLSFYYVTSREAARPQSACVNLKTADLLISAVRIHQHVMRTADYDHEERGREIGNGKKGHVHDVTAVVTDWRIRLVTSPLPLLASVAVTAR